MQAARRRAIPSRCSICRSTRRPPSQDIIPPSNRASIGRAQIGDRPGKTGAASSLAGMARPGSADIRIETKILCQISALSPCPPALVHNSG